MISHVGLFSKTKRDILTTKTKQKPKQKPSPAPIATPEPPAVTTSKDLDMQCVRCSELIDSLESQMAELELQHMQHEQALKQMKAEQEIRCHLVSHVSLDERVQPGGKRHETGICPA
jgi:hypothetical protein